METTYDIKQSFHVHELPTSTKPSNDETLICRICWEAQTEDEDPILMLGCNCTKPLGQAHRSCLFKWFTRPVLNYHNGLFHKSCEICRANLSPSILSLILIQLSGTLTRNIENQEVLIDVIQENEEMETTPSSNTNNSLLKKLWFKVFILWAMSTGIWMLIHYFNTKFTHDSHRSQSS